MYAPDPVRPPVESRRNAVVAAIVAAAILVTVLAVTFEWPSPQGSPGCTGLECGGGMVAIGSPVAKGGPGNYSYIMAIAPSGGARWGQVEITLQDSSGGELTPSSHWSVEILSAGPPPSTVAIFDFETGSWTLGATVLMTSAQSIDLQLGPTDLHGQGDSIVLHFLATSGGSESGETSTTLP
jgi:hypothetical protein